MDRYLAAVSGGPDSMAVLDQNKDKVKCVCHVDYNLRKTSKRDYKIVKDYCEKNNLRFISVELNPDMSKVKNFQSWARTARYAFFKKYYEKYKCTSVITGHNKDDFIETAYFQKNNRGTPRVTYGFKKDSTIMGMNIHRPSINVWKWELEDYCKENEIPYGIDESNFSNQYTRNMIRNVIKENWSFQQKQSYYEEIIEHNKNNFTLEKHIQNKYRTWHNSSFDLDVFKTLDIKTQELVILRYLSINDQRISMNKIQGICEFLNGDKLFKNYRIKENTFISVDSRRVKITHI